MLYFINAVLSFAMLLWSLTTPNPESVIVLMVGGLVGLIIANSTLMIVSELKKIKKRLPKQDKPKNKKEEK